MKSSRTELPVVCKDVPLPKLNYRSRNPRQCRSRWYSFLQSLEPGDSFVIKVHESQSVMLAAKKAEVMITWRKEGSDYRIWRVSEELMPDRPRHQRLVKKPEPAKKPEFSRASEPSGLTGEDLSLL